MTFVEQNTAIYSGNRNGTSVCFMFNVYQGTEFIEPIMEVFKSFEFTTTFFVGGIWAERNMDLVKKISDEGFEVANHGYLHRDADKLSQSRNREEIVITERLIAAIIGKPPVKLFAPPSGAIGANMFTVCKELQYSVIMWTRDTIDWRDHNSSLIQTRAIKNLAAGDLVLMHPTKETLAALPEVLNAVKNQKLIASTVTQKIVIEEQKTVTN